MDTGDRGRIWGLCLGFFVLLLAGPALARAGDTVKLALVAPLTGNLAAAGANIKAGVAMQVEAVNAAGGIGGKPVELVPFDDICEPRAAASVALAVARDPDIIGVVGHMCSSAHLAALPTYVREGIPVVTPTATSVVISSRNRDEEGRVWSFRAVYRDDFQGKFLATYMAKIMGFTRVALIHENNDYGIGLKKSFLKQARRRGLAVVGLATYKKGDLDFMPQLTALRAAKPQGLCIAGDYAEAARIADQARTLGLAIPKFGADAMDNPDYMRLAGQAAEETYLTAPALDGRPGSPGQRFIEAYTARFGHEPIWMSAYAYDAAGVLLAAAVKAGPERDKIRRILAGMRDPETAYADITGPLFFDANGDSQRPAFVKLVRDGRFVPAPKQLN